MKTRSQSKKENSYIFEVNINFDEASTEWKSNKLYKGNGCYRYICEKNTKSGSKCKREPKAGNCFCAIHLSQLTKCHSQII
jgi:hypothetical protein